MVESKKTAGRQKIKLSKIDKESNRQVTFSKRKAGLFKKAAEISVMSGAQAAVFILSNKHRPYSFANPVSLLDVCLNGNDNTTVARNAARYNHDHDHMTIVPREEDNLWWWNVPLEGMPAHDFPKYKDLLEEMEMRSRIILQEKKFNLQTKEDHCFHCL